MKAATQTDVMQSYDQLVGQLDDATALAGLVQVLGELTEGYTDDMRVSNTIAAGLNVVGRLLGERCGEARQAAATMLEAAGGRP